MSKLGLKRKDARNIDSFRRCGYDYKKVEQTDYYMVWSMTKYDDDTHTLHRYGYEVWRPKWFKNSDGTVVWAKPSDEDFGTYGWYCPTVEQKDIRIQKVLQDYLARES